MSKPVLLEPDKCFQLTCGRCGKNLFTVYIDGSGATCHCLSCGKNYKLESQTGVKIANA